MREGKKINALQLLIILKNVLFTRCCRALVPRSYKLLTAIAARELLAYCVMRQRGKMAIDRLAFHE